MKYRLVILTTAMLLLFSHASFGEPDSLDYLIKTQRLKNKNMIEKFKDYDFSILFSGDLYNLSYIGSNYRRIQIKLISVLQNPNNHSEYLIYGKSKVLDKISEFQGSIKITEIRQYSPLYFGCEDEYKDKGIQFQGLLVADYLLFENQNEKNAGCFKGKVYSAWYLNRDNKVNYDPIESCSDATCNNQFVGHWTAYSTKQKKICNWGDGRIPQSGDLDIGASEFGPSEKYYDQGWEVYAKAYDLFGPKEEMMKARETEEKEWWK
jgi:hypothetical protein